jgi:sRNA-binding carbon storage regulator CsrA
MQKIDEDTQALTEEQNEWFRNSVNIDEWPKEMDEERLELYQTIQQQAAEESVNPTIPMKETEDLPF